MKAKYQKYYDALKGADLGSGVSALSSAVSTSSNELAAVKSNSAAWQELGAQTFNNVTIPGLIDAVSTLSSNITGPLTQVVSKCSELVSQLTELDSLEKERESLGDKWTYTEGGSKTKSEVNDHNNKIDELEKKITEKESEIDGLISAIDGITVEEISVVSAPAGTNTGTDINLEANPADTTGAENTVSDGKVYSDGKVKYSIPSDPVIAAKKAAFLGNADDPNNYTHFQGTKAKMFDRHNELTMFDNTTGQVLKDLDTITLKPGETRIITVKLPSDTGEITKITRTTSDGNGAYRSGKIVTARSDIDPDPNNIEYVRIVEGGSYHMPANQALLKNNSYDWIITAKSKGKCNASQTAMYSSTDTGPKRNLKAMVELQVNVVE